MGGAWCQSIRRRVHGRLQYYGAVATWAKQSTTAEGAGGRRGSHGPSKAPELSVQGPFGPSKMPGLRVMGHIGYQVGRCSGHMGCARHQ